jgi:kynurenine formamidase
MQTRAIPVERDGFIGAVNRGGGCNVSVANVDIHCTGTHTECVGHIDDSGIIITDVCPTGFISASLVSLETEIANETSEKYHVPFCDEDRVITKKNLVEKWSGKSPEVLILRTLPNNENKKSLNYDENPAPFFTNDAIDYITHLGVQNLLVDLPSIDKADDGGQLGNHNRFFEKGKTISELLYIPNSVLDGFGFLQIQIPNWGLDAAPSRPIFYPV